MSVAPNVERVPIVALNVVSWSIRNVLTLIRKNARAVENVWIVVRYWQSKVSRK